MSQWKEEEQARDYLEIADQIPNRSAGEAVLLDEIPADARRILDLGAGDGRLLALVLQARPGAMGVALDFSAHFLELLSKRFGAGPRVEIVDHDLAQPLPRLGEFDAVVSSFAIHHLPHERKRRLYEEVWAILEPGGVFANLEHVAPPSPRAHDRFLEAMGITPAEEDGENRLLDMETQLEWLREIGFAEVDCYWKWRELALLIGARTSGAKP